MYIPCAVNLLQMKNIQIITYFLFKKLTDQGHGMEVHMRLYFMTRMKI